jgi:hypothetical protein
MEKRMNTQAVLAKLAEIRRSIPRLNDAPRPEKTSRVDAQSVEEFELAAVADALETLGEDLRATIREAEDRLYEQCLDVYYAAEELARDPEHANVIPHVEALRKAHENSYGRAIPTKEETEARRRKPREEGTRSGGLSREESRRQA